MFPTFNTDGEKTIRLPVKLANPIEFRSTLQGAIQSIRPTMIGAAKYRGISRRLSGHRRGVMPADVKKCAQHAVCAPHRDDRFTSNRGGDVVSRGSQLVGAADYL